MRALIIMGSRIPSRLVHCMHQGRIAEYRTREIYGKGGGDFLLPRGPAFPEWVVELPTPCPGGQAIQHEKASEPLI
ncbi:hypothetical protein MRX96_037225 [Rhipicephalus microplus]